MIQLRKLTRLSILPQGCKYEGLTVGDLLKSHKTYLIWQYFNYDRITFTDQILDELKIKEEDRIDKPGKDPKKFKYYGNRNHFLAAKQVCNNPTNKDSIVAVISITNKKRKKAAYVGFLKRDKTFYSKLAMQQRNHRK